MLIDHPPRTSDEIVRLGLDLMRCAIEPRLSKTDVGRFVCVDVDTGEFELADDDLTAVDRLQARLPSADTYVGQVGEEATFRVGRL